MIGKPQTNPTTLARRARWRRLRGFSGVDMAVGSVVMLMVLSASLSIGSVTLRAADKLQTEAEMVGDSRLAMDETLFQLRASNKVLASQTVGGTSYTSSGTQVVLSAPAYNPSTTDFYIDGVTDYVVLRYDSSSKKVFETVVPGTGSVRPSRTDFVLAEDVKSCAFTYRVREYFSSTATGNTSFSLSTTPLSTPTVYVNGTLTTSSYNSGNGKVTVNLGSNKSSNVQVIYTVNPASGSTALDLVVEVDVAMELEEYDARKIVRTTNLQGAARLRNVRK